MKEQKTVIIAGGFDPLQPGHIDHILKAGALGNKLIVILQTDRNLIRKKGYYFMPFTDRLNVLYGVQGVSLVVENLDKDGTCTETLKYYKGLDTSIQIFAKGGDRTPENMPQEEVNTCKELGIEIKYGIGDLLGSSTEYFKKAVIQYLESLNLEKDYFHKTENMWDWLNFKNRQIVADFLDYGEKRITGEIK